MKKATLVITVLAALIGTASVSFGDNSCTKNLTAKNSLQKLTDLKGQLVVDEQKRPVGHLENDPRRPIDRIKNPEYNAIGMVSSNLGRGSGWLGNECLVWTAKHVLGRNKKVIGQKVKFSVGQTQVAGKNFEYEVDGVVVASGNPDAKRNDAGPEDWALIKLNKSVGKKVGYVETAQYSVEDAKTCKELEVAGYPGEKSVKSLWWQGSCTYTDKESDFSAFLVGCPVTPGNSGGPLLCRETDGKLYAIGIMNQQVESATKGLAVNFTGDWTKAKTAFLKYLDTCD